VARVQRADGIVLVSAVWFDAVARTLASAPASYAIVSPGGTEVIARDGWRGLKPSSLRGALESLGFTPSDSAISRLIRANKAHGLPIASDHLGEMIGLTANQRKRARAFSIEAFDCSKRQRKAETAARRAANDAAAKESKRRAAGAAAREAYLAAVSTGRPWVAEGVSRDAIYKRRRRQREAMSTGVSAFFSTPLPGVSACFEDSLSTGVSAHFEHGVYRCVGAPISYPSKPVPSTGSGPLAEPPVFDRDLFFCQEQEEAASGSSLQRSGRSSRPSVGADVPAGQSRLSDELRAPNSEASKKETARLGRPSQEEVAARELFVKFGLFSEEIGDCNSDVARRRADLLGEARVTRLFRQIEAITAGGFVDLAEYDRAMGRARALAIRLETTRTRNLETTGASDA
jgi:hypothetical protein